MSKHKILLVLGALTLALVMAPGLLAQSDPSDGYGNWDGGVQSRNIPAGSVNDPGSHLTYIVDTGVNARKAFGVNLRNTTGTVLTDMASVLDQNGDGQLDANAIITNFVGITNTHPTMAVTVHFRYYNDNCEDVLDFLVILTCNDTLVFNPFDFVIPGTNLNTSNRFFRGATSGVLTPISTLQWGSGRFVITAAASGANLDGVHDADILFPQELGKDLDDICNIQHTGTLTGSDALNSTLAGTVRNTGEAAGLVYNNLHVFNASQISFNYLIGVQTMARPVQVGGALNFQAGGTNAWARPAITRDIESDALNTHFNGWPAGDGRLAPTGMLVLGGEPLSGYPVRSSLTGRDWELTGNPYFLRNDVHGGTVEWDGSGDSWSYYGALGTAPFYSDPASGNPTFATDMVLHFLSVADDYNGSNNTSPFGNFPDKAANIEPAATVYVMQIYDNNEDPLILTGTPPLNVSPPSIEDVVELKITCFCLRTFFTTRIIAGTNLDDFTVQEIADAGVPEILAGKGAFDGLFKPSGADVSGGWIRFVRDNTEQIDLRSAVTGNGLGTAPGVDFANYLFAEAGTATIDDEAFDDHFRGASFLTIASTYKVRGGFGTLYWTYAVPSSAKVSENGDPGYDCAKGHSPTGCK